MDLELNNQQGLICNKTKTNQTKNILCTKSKCAVDFNAVTKEFDHARLGRSKTLDSEAMLQTMEGNSVTH